MSAKREPKQTIVHKCSCGCGTETRNAFAPGHDNRFYGQVIRGDRDASELEAFPGLMRKWQGRQMKLSTTKEDRSDTAEIAGETPAEPKDDMWTEEQPNQTTAPAGEYSGPSFNEVKDGRWWYPVKTVRVLDDGRYEVDWFAKNGGARTTRVAADKLR